MRLDATDLRYITADEFRVLTAAEMGSKNHELVPTTLIAELSGIRGGQVNKLCGQLAKRNLIARIQHAKYDGYRLTYGGLDYLALRTFVRRKPPSCASVGKKVGVGKESDIYVVKDQEGEKRILKLHRLGRISFRAIKSKRDYLGQRASASWMYMSRLSAQKEFTYMKILYDHGFPVPTPIDSARHAIVMSLVDGDPLRAVMEVPDVGGLYGELMELIMRFARAGLIHGDFNEFNIMIRRKTFEPVVIDFPQMVSTRHENAEYFFNRDVNCVRRFFRKRFRFEGESWPVWGDVLEMEREYGTEIVAKAKGEEESDEESEEGEESEEEESEEEEESDEEEEEGEEKGEEKGEEEAKLGDAEEATATATSGPEPRVRLDLLVEASGFGRKMQRELENYMTQVADLPASDREDSEEEESEEEESEEEEEDGEAEAEGEAKESSSEDAAAALEKLRLHRALGNDGAPGEELPPLSDEEAYLSDSSSSSGVSDAGTDYTQYVRPARAARVRPSTAAVSKLGGIDELKTIVSADLERTRRGDARHHARKTGAGKAKGAKWKSSAQFLTGKKGSTGWD